MTSNLYLSSEIKNVENNMYIFVSVSASTFTDRIVTLSNATNTWRIYKSNI
jgi:hypothetical protein